jgi:hypothetical protein
MAQLDALVNQRNADTALRVASVCAGITNPETTSQQIRNFVILMVAVA